MPTPSAIDSAPPVSLGSAEKSSLVLTYLQLGKARLSTLVLITTLVGFLLGSRGGAIDWMRLILVLVGTGLVVFGANAFNQVIEQDRDARMVRTRTRPLPAGRVTPLHAMVFAGVCSGGGLLILASSLNLLTMGLAAAALLVYAAIYTPLKPRSSLNTLVGAIPGAIPPVIGWTGATGRIDLGAVILFATLFAWQIPHFLALAWLYREDYERGGFRMLPHEDPSGAMTSQLAVIYSAVLIPLGLAITLAGLSGWVYAVGAIVLGGLFCALSVNLFFRRTEQNARRLFLGSVLYLPLLLGLMIADANPATQTRRVFFEIRPAAALPEAAAYLAPAKTSVLGQTLGGDLPKSPSE